MPTGWTHNRKRGAGGRSSPSVATRLEGANRAKRAWICRECFAWNTARPENWETSATKPKQCIACGHNTWHYCDSRGEARRFVDLVLEQKVGTIRSLVHHPRYPLAVLDQQGRAHIWAHYEADTSYERLAPDSTWIPVVEDFKPKDPRAQDPIFVLKRRAFELAYGIPITIVS